METTATPPVRVRQRVTPDKIMQVGMGFWASKILLTAVNIGLFTRLGRGPADARKLKLKLGLHERSTLDFLDSLVALGFITRKGVGWNAVYSNAEDTDLFLDKNKSTYMGGILEMSNNRLYPFWNDLEEALKSGKPQNEAKDGSKPFFGQISGDEKKLREFVQAMGGVQVGNFFQFSKEFDFSEYETLCDIGGAGAHLATQVATNQPHMSCVSFDLPEVTKIAHENIERMDFSPRVRAMAGDMFKDNFPKVDVITMGNILHDWGIEDRKKLIKKAYDALPDGGALVVIENIIDDERRLNTFGLMMSLNMLIETHEGADFTGAEFETWAKEAGFKKTVLMPLNGPASAVIAYK
ncbi:MAG: methyltransferase domain-containing protein [Eudoraea sp.]|nr:methyltransferase domain-containing protein [Eudoraea sp.]